MKHLEGRWGTSLKTLKCRTVVCLFRCWFIGVSSLTLLREEPFQNPWSSHIGEERGFVGPLPMSQLTCISVLRVGEVGGGSVWDGYQLAIAISKGFRHTEIIHFAVFNEILFFMVLSNLSLQVVYQMSVQIQMKNNTARYDDKLPSQLSLD